MKKVFQYCFIFLIFSCQKYYSIENGQKAIGSLQNNITLDCLPKTVAGSYVEAVGLTDSNFIQVSVNITALGIYVITTDTVNGYSFKASGSFTSLGINQVKLMATGNPIAAGLNTFKISFDSSICYLSITVIAKNPVSVFTLHGSPNNCMNYTVHGIYAKGIPLTDSNKVTIELNVLTPGSYTLSTDTVNGYYFAGSGLLTLTGIQSVNLQAIGTALQQGINTFTVNAISSKCTFTDTVVTTVNTQNNDHFPLTLNSYWNYDDLLNTGDTLNRKIIDSVITNGIYYKTMLETSFFATVTQSIFNKTDTNYYEYCSADKYTTSLKFAPQINGNLLFLKENLTTGSTWISDEYFGPATISSQIIYLRYKFTCIDANAIVTINGKTFANVYKILVQPQLRSAPTYPYASTGEETNIYYAKGVGIIYSKIMVNNYLFQERQIRNWLVN